MTAEFRIPHLEMLEEIRALRAVHDEMLQASILAVASGQMEMKRIIEPIFVKVCIDLRSAITAYEAYWQEANDFLDAELPTWRIQIRQRLREINREWLAKRGRLFENQV